MLRGGWVGVVGLAASLLVTLPARGQEARKMSYLPGFGQFVRVVELKAGQQAKVIAAGDVRRDPDEPEPPPVRMGLYVFDVHGNCLAWDDFSPGKGSRDNAVAFVPPENGRYTVVVRNFNDRGYMIRLTTP